jgi:aromatic ring-cleaving dioxygenase
MAPKNGVAIQENPAIIRLTMEPGVNEQITLTDEERTLLVELLERERGDLPAEIHHTRTHSVRDELHTRVHRVEQLLTKLRPAS